MVKKIVPEMDKNFTKNEEKKMSSKEKKIDFFLKINENEEIYQKMTKKTKWPKIDFQEM